MGRGFFPFLCCRTPRCNLNRNSPVRKDSCNPRSTPAGFWSIRRASSAVCGLRELRARDRSEIHEVQSVLMPRTRLHSGEVKGRGWSESVNAASTPTLHARRPSEHVTHPRRASVTIRTSPVRPARCPASVPPSSEDWGARKVEHTRYRGSLGLMQGPVRRTPNPQIHNLVTVRIEVSAGTRYPSNRVSVWPPVGVAGRTVVNASGTYRFPCPVRAWRGGSNHPQLVARPQVRA